MKGSVIAGRSRGSDVRGGGSRERRSGAGARKPGSCGGKRRASGEERSRDGLSNLHDRRGGKGAELVPLSETECATNGRGVDTRGATPPVHARGDRRAQRSPGSLLAAATRSGVSGELKLISRPTTVIWVALRKLRSTIHPSLTRTMGPSLQTAMQYALSKSQGGSHGRAEPGRA